MNPRPEYDSGANLACNPSVSRIEKSEVSSPSNPRVVIVLFAWPSVIDRISRCRLALLVIVVALSVPEIASASCGSHVTYVGDKGHVCKPGVDCPLLPATPAPCNGPGCSQAPDTPPLAPSTAPRSTTDEFALSSFLVVVPESGRWFGPSPLESHAIHRVYPPDPPPRDRAHF